MDDIASAYKNNLEKIYYLTIKEGKEFSVSYLYIILANSLELNKQIKSDMWESNNWSAI